MLIVLYIFSLVIGGVFVQKFILKGTFGIALALFLGTDTFILFYLMSLGLRLNKLVILFPLFFLPLIIIHLFRHFSFKKIMLKKTNAFTCLLVFIILIIILGGILQIINRPIFERDGLGIWLTKAKMIYLDKTIYSENFFNPQRIHDHPRYPLFLPILEASYFFINGVNERTVKILTIFIWVLILGVLFETLYKKSADPTSCQAGQGIIKGSGALLALILIATIPAYWTIPDGSLSTGYADIPLSLFYLCSYILLSNYFITGEKKFISHTGLALAFAMFTKEEGFAFALSVFVLLFFTKKKNIDILLLLTCAIIPVVPWLIVRARITDLYAEHYLSHLSELPSCFSNISIILKNAFFEFANFKHWGIFWIIVSGIFVYPKYKKSTIYLLLLTGLLFVFYLGIFLLTPWDINFQMRVVFPRMLLHITPSLVFLVFQHSLQELQLAK